MFRSSLLIGAAVLLSGCAQHVPVTRDQAKAMDDERLVRAYSVLSMTQYEPYLKAEIYQRGLVNSDEAARYPDGIVRIGDRRLFVYLAWPDIRHSGGLQTASSYDSWVYSPTHGYAYFDENDKVVALGN